MTGPRHSLYWLIIAAAATLISLAARADNFADIRYSPQTDRLVVTMLYRGTNPNHQLLAKMGAVSKQASRTVCRAQRAEILDDQYDDTAEQDFQ